MSKADELKAKNENLFERNTILLNENERLKKENAELRENNSFLNNLVREKEQRGLEIQEDLLKENAELKKNFKDLEEFYEKEYFEIADKTTEERIKELEQYETEITEDDYSPYDENTWGLMHEEIFVPKNLVIDMLKEIYAYVENLKKENAELEAQIEKMKCCSNCDNWNWKHSKCEKKLKGDCFKQSKWILRR